MSDQSSAIARLFGGCVTARRRITIAFELAGATGAAWTDDDGEAPERGDDFLMRQVGAHRRRHHRDGAQRDQRAGARHAPRSAPATATSRSVTCRGARRPAGPRA